MSTVPPPPTLPPTYTPRDGSEVPPSSDEPGHSSEVKLISHSNLFYWWPVWMVCFVMAAVTWMDGTRMAVVPSNSTLTWQTDAEGNKTNKAVLTLPTAKGTNSLNNAAGISASNAERGENYTAFGPRISERAWPGALFVVTLMITVFVTNVPLRGLLSFMVIMGIAMLALIFALLDVWDSIFELLGDLHIHMNMAAYVTIGTITFLIWAAATFFFDRRTFVIFTPGQIRLRDHIGDGIKAYPTMGASLEKKRNDIFRHIIFGLGSGDLIIHLSGRERQEIRLENVLFLGWRMAKVENVLRSLATAE